MRKVYCLLLSVVLVVILASVSFAGQLERATEKVNVTQAKSIEIEGELGCGEFRITVDSITEAALFEIRYDERAVRYDVDYHEKGDRGFLTFESDRRSNVKFDGDDNRWDIVLSNKYESSLNLDIGACEAKIDLGGIPLKELSINLGAASGQIDFGKPNPIRLEEFKMDAGVSSLTMASIGNANFSRFIFNGGLGSYELDFRGKYKGESEIFIEIGLGSAEIFLPADIPIRVETDSDNFLSSVDFHGDNPLKIDDDTFESGDFEGAKTRIILHLLVGLGSVDIYFKN